MGEEDRDQASEQAPAPRRLPYEPPRILDQEPLEMVAGVCSPGKAVSQPGDCVTVQNS